MAFEGHNELLPAIEQALKEATEPLTCHQLYEREDVRSATASVNRVSDYLSVLFRRGAVARVAAPATPGQRVRWAYVWRKKDSAAPADVDMPGAKVYKPKTLVDRTNLTITEDGRGVKIELPGLVITISKT